MTVLAGQTIMALGIISPCNQKFMDPNGNSAGLGPCGYDLTLDQAIDLKPGGFTLASTVEKFSLPGDICCIIHDKSSLARRGLSVLNTVAEPGWRGYLTLELTNHGPEYITLGKGSAIAQAIFHRLDAYTFYPYVGKYQDQERGPVEAR